VCVYVCVHVYMCVCVCVCMWVSVWCVDACVGGLVCGVMGAPKSLKMVTAAMKLSHAPWRKSYDQPRQRIKKQRH